jgi:hypothetical protein
MAYMIKNAARRLGAAPDPCDDYKKHYEYAVLSAESSERWLSEEVANYQKYYPLIKDPETLELMTKNLDASRADLEKSDAWVQETKTMWDECVKRNRTAQEPQNKPEGFQVPQMVKKTLVPAGILLLVGYLALK